jgi:excisionase family DNA binding protein
MSHKKTVPEVPIARTASIIPTPVISQPAVQVAAEPLAVNVETAARLAGVPAWTVNEAILTGSLKAKHAGRQRIIPFRELQTWIASLDDVEPSTAPSILKRVEARA